MELRPEQESKMMMRDVGMWWCSPKRVASFIGVRAYENTEHTIVSRVAAVLYAPNRMVLPESGGARRHTGPRDEDLHHDLSLAHGRRLEIHALVVDTLERAACGSGRCSWA